MEGLLAQAPEEEGALPNTDTDSPETEDLSAVVAPDTIPDDLVESVSAADADAADDTSDEDAPARSADVDTTAAAGEGNDSLMKVVTEYGKYVALFVGAGLISGSVVHFPLAPVRYAIIGGIGGAIFAVASVLADRAGKDTVAVARLAVSSLLLALGIGMISGSIQHFQDIPDRAANLIPLGVALSITAFIVRNDLRPRRDDIAALALWTVTAVLFLGIGLGRLADAVPAPAAGGDHHATEEPAKAKGADTEAKSGDKSAESENSEKDSEAAAEAEHAEDGHGH